MGAYPDLQALDLLVRVAESGSLGAAARAVGIAQPNASRSLSRLERQLGLKLLVRTPSGSKLTTEGEVVVTWAREALTAVERVALSASSLAAQRAAQLTVAASLTVAEYLAPAWLARFRHEQPDSHVTLYVGNSEHVVTEVLAGRAPLGFVETPRVPRTVASTIVARDQLVVVVGRDHPWARRRNRVAAHELAQADLVLRESGSGTRQTLERALSKAGQELGEVHLELASTVAVKAAASAGGAAAVLSELAVIGELAAGQLIRVETEGIDLTRALRAVWEPNRPPQGPAAQLIKMAKG